MVDASTLPDAALSDIASRFKPELLLALQIRTVEECLLELFSKGELNGTVHTCVGQELVPAMLASRLTAADYILSNHRGHGHFLSTSGNMAGLIAEIMGREGGVAGGYGGSQHLHAGRFFSNGIQGGMSPIAAGLAASLKQSDALVVCFIGDGTLGEGVLYESLNLASIWELPVLFVLEDNGYAQSTASRQTTAGTVDGRASGFGIRYLSASTADIATLDCRVAEAVAHVRKNRCPSLLHVETRRLNSHSKGDDNRDDREIARYRDEDVLSRILKHRLLPAAEIEAVVRGVNDAVDMARSTPKLGRVQPFRPTTFEPVAYASLPGVDRGKHADELNQALRRLLDDDSGLMIIGEDIEEQNDFTPKPYGGAFKITRGLSRLYGARVRNTPISEAGIVGFGIGRALAGLPTIVEIMFGDFSTLIVDQLIQHAAKFPTMFGVDVRLPLVIRTPMGGRRGYGPTHSQSIEKLFLGWQNLAVVVPNRFVDLTELYRAALFANPGPSFVVENKQLYGRSGLPARPAGYDVSLTSEAFPMVRLSPVRGKASCTIVTYGFSLELVMEALVELAMEHEVFCDVFAPTILCPLNLTALAQSAAATKRVLTVEEGPTFAAFGSEVLASLVASGTALSAARRLGNDTIIPCALDAELALMPQSSKIVSTCLDLVRHV